MGFGAADRALIPGHAVETTERQYSRSDRRRLDDIRQRLTPLGEKKEAGNPASPCGKRLKLLLQRSGIEGELEGAEPASNGILCASKNTRQKAGIFTGTHERIRTSGLPLRSSNVSAVQSAV